MTEFLLVVAIPLAWAVWELVSLFRHRADEPKPNAPPRDDAPVVASVDDEPTRPDAAR